MNRFGEIADELTELIEELEQPAFAAEAAALRDALQRAFNKACLAERDWRRTHGDEAVQAPAPRRRRSAAAEPTMGVVIELPTAWRQRRAAGARLDE